MSEIFDRITLLTKNPEKYMLRGLKGGGGGGGSRGSSGGGSSGGGYIGGGYNNGSHHSSNSNCYYDDDCHDGVPTWVIILFVVIIVIVLLFFLARKIFYAEQMKEEMVRVEAALGDFESRLGNARSDYEGYFASKGSSTEGEGSPQSGTYIVTYMDRGKTCDGEVTLTFKESDNGKGYMITGTSNDDDGHAVIDEGYVSFDGMKAWWKDRSVTGNIGMMVLNEGSFNFKTNTFMGKWVSSLGTEGHFTRFSLKGSASASDAHGNGQTHTQAPEGAPETEAEFAVNQSAPPAPSTYTVDNYKPGEVQPSAPTATTTDNSSTVAAPSIFDQMMGGMKK